MCGIFGYIGKKPCINILYNGLKRLEYRGYDSSGIFIQNKNGNYKLIKSIGKINNLQTKINKEEKNNILNKYTMGIAHTRWATHGKPLEKNTHPHFDQNKNFFVVHNGIIENYKQLKKSLQNEGYKFYSDTDTEIIPNLFDKFGNNDLVKTAEKVLNKIQGAYAIIVANKNKPDELLAIKRGSPLVLGINEKEFYFSSDKQALSGFASQCINLEDGEIIHIKGDIYTIKNENNIIKKKIEKIDLKSIETSKGKYDTFMYKEILEQPEIVKNSFKGRINFKTKDIYSNSVEFLKDKEINKVIFVGCGTALNAGKLGTRWIQDLVGIDSHFETSSEYLYKNIKHEPKTLHVFVSQSGETADTIEVLKYIKKKGLMTIGIVNVVGSTIANLTDCGFFQRAGYEIGVASTKAFTAQLIHILFLSLYLGRKYNLSYNKFNEIIYNLKKLPDLINQTIKSENIIKKVAKDLSKYENIYFLGRNYELPIADEGSLKLKEISYIHSESYPAGELKHGPLALIEKNFPSIILSPNNYTYNENISTIEEIKSRNGKVLLISDKKTDIVDWFIPIPQTENILQSFLLTIVIQLLSYHVAKKLGNDIDKPRNLAKSVTVK